MARPKLGSAAWAEEKAKREGKVVTKTGARSPSSGGRTKSESSLGKSMAAGGNRVSPTNLPTPPTSTGPTRSPKRPSATRKTSATTSPRKAKKSESSVLTTLNLDRDIQRLREKYGTGSKSRVPRGVEADPMKALVRSVKVDDAGTVTKVAGAKVVGSPTVREVRRAYKKGTLEQGGRRQVTTPKVRRQQKKVAGQVKRAERKLKRARRKADPRIRIAGPEGVFVNTLAKKTGLSPKVVAAWTRAEGGNSTQDWNRLNIGHTDSGPIGLTADGGWSNPKTAAKLSAQFLKGRYGGASEGIRAILPASKGASDQQQIANIAGSGWATNPDYHSLISAVYGDVSEPVTRADTERLRQAKELAADIDEDARRLGIRGVKGLTPDGKKDVAEVFVARKKEGPYAGSRKIVSKILGQPVWGDKEEGHSSTGDHDPSQPNAYAQDIGSAGGNPAEGEEGLGYDEKTLDTIEANLRKLGGDVPELSIGQNWDGNIQGYQIQLITEVHGTGPHIHLGARWTGEDPPPGTVSGSVSGNTWATASSSPSGVSTSGSAPAALVRGPARKKKRQQSVLDVLAELGYRVTPEGVKKSGESAAASPDTDSVLSDLRKKYA